MRLFGDESASRFPPGLGGDASGVRSLQKVTKYAKLQDRLDFSSRSLFLYMSMVVGID